MARSTYIYIVRAKENQNVVGAFTVKYEAHRETVKSNIPLEQLELMRCHDGSINWPEVIPWDMKEIEKYRNG